SYLLSLHDALPILGSLEQPDARAPFPARPLQRGEHESPADPRILHPGIDRDRAQPGDRRALVEEVAPDDAAVQLGDDGIEAWMGEQPTERLRRVLGGWEVGGEAVMLGERAERLVADAAACRRVVRCSRP